MFAYYALLISYTYKYKFTRLSGYNLWYNNKNGYQFIKSGEPISKIN